MRHKDSFIKTAQEKGTYILQKSLELEQHGFGGGGILYELPVGIGIQGDR